MSCSSPANACVVNAFRHTRGIPVIVARSVFHEAKQSTAASPQPAPRRAVLTYLRGLRTEVATTAWRSASTQKSVTERLRRLIDDVTEGRTQVDRQTLAAWQAMPSTLHHRRGQATLTGADVFAVPDDTLRQSIPNVTDSELHAVRQAWGRWVTYHAPRRNLDNWREAWNAYTGATPDQEGAVRVRPDTCPTCSGTGHLPRTLASGKGVIAALCTDCQGSGRGRTPVSYPATWIPVPPAGDITSR